MSQTDAPELSPKLDWLNADQQCLAMHRGRAVALLFWSASSVYCHNLLADLSALQRRHPDALSVLCIHLPKFNAELEPKILADVLNRLGVTLPVAQDAGWVTWQHYGIQSWPSVVLINPEGRQQALFSGDECISELENQLSEMIQNLEPSPKPKALQAKPKNKVFSVLHSPCGILNHNNLLYIADTGHNRVLECSKDGQVKRVFGNGLPLFLDGNSGDASFNRPMAIQANRDYLYVADTGNHAVRRISFLHGTVDTLIGNGIAGESKAQAVSSFKAVLLNNPTGLYVQNDMLVISEAGNNRLSLYNLANNQFTPLAGGGALALQDGIGERARMAHPLALSGDSRHLYVIEGSSSSLRTAAVPEGRINTLIGLGLFQFGLSDGARQQANMQHPCGIVVDEKRATAWIADAYNHKIRVLNLQNNQLSTLKTSQPMIHPCAVAVDADSLWIVDSASSYLYRYFFVSDYMSRITVQMA